MLLREWEMSIRVFSELLKKIALRCPPSPGKTSCRVPVSWLILPVVICLSQKFLAYMILSVQENEVENSNGSLNERRTFNLNNSGNSDALYALI